jgi:hypothetical protein
MVWILSQKACLLSIAVQVHSSLSSKWIDRKANADFECIAPQLKGDMLFEREFKSKWGSQKRLWLHCTAIRRRLAFWERIRVWMTRTKFTLLSFRSHSKQGPRVLLLFECSNHWNMISEWNGGMPLRAIGFSMRSRAKWVCMIEGIRVHWINYWSWFQSSLRSRSINLNLKLKVKGGGTYLNRIYPLVCASLYVFPWHCEHCYLRRGGVFKERKNWSNNMHCLFRSPFWSRSEILDDLYHTG